MHNNILVRLHAAGASHGELRLFSNVPEIAGPVPDFLSASAIRAALVRSGIREDRSSELSEGCIRDAAARAVDAVRSAGARVVLESDPEYPSQFLEMPRRPFLLYVR